ncbi:hypothetical protein [Streptomyces sp. NPDC085479]|uniref:hypothetical protein n=1 Tax=Streptomyces sp. NPDC085479 TaxID=3365726 RepID=UPI0037CF4B43
MRDPVVVGDGAVGPWKTLAEVFPAAHHQRCWVHKEQLLAFNDFPAEHRIQQRTTNPIELAMAFKLFESAQSRWWAITGAHLVPLVCAGTRFENGRLVERTENHAV